MNKLYKIKVTHFAPKDSNIATDEYVVADDERQVFDYLDNGKGGWESYMQGQIEEDPDGEEYYKEDFKNKEWWLDDVSEDFYLKACPYFLDCGVEDLHENTMVGDYGSVKGCRGISCEECLVKNMTEIDKFRKEYYNLFAEKDLSNPNTPLEIAMLNVFTDRFKSIENSYIRRYISLIDFKEEARLLNHIVSRCCHELEINLDCIARQSMTGEYFKPNTMPRYIDIEGCFSLYMSEFQEVRAIFDRIRRDVIQSNKEARENRAKKELIYWDMKF